MSKCNAISIERKIWCRESTPSSLIRCTMRSHFKPMQHSFLCLCAFQSNSLASGDKRTFSLLLKTISSKCFCVISLLMIWFMYCFFLYFEWCQLDRLMHLLVGVLSDSRIVILVCERCKILELFEMRTCLGPGARMPFRPKWKNRERAFLLHCVGNKSCVVHWNEFLIQCVRFWVEFSPYCSVTKTFAIGLQNDLIAKKYYTEKIRTPENIYPQKVYKPFKEVKRRNLSSITTYSSVKACSSDPFSQKVYFLKMFFAKIFKFSFFLE